MVRFMCFVIWQWQIKQRIGEIKKLMGLGSKKLICSNEQLENAWCTPELLNQIVSVPNQPYQGGLVANVIFAGITCALLFTVPKDQL